MAKIVGGVTTTPMPIPDWNQTDPNKADYIKNKPDFDAKQDKFAYVSITGNMQYVAMEKPTHFIGNGESGLLIHNLADPSAPLDAVNKRYVDGLVGDIESALDSVIALQDSLIGGDA